MLILINMYKITQFFSNQKLSMLILCKKRGILMIMPQHLLMLIWDPKEGLISLLILKELNVDPIMRINWNGNLMEVQLKKIALLIIQPPLLFISSLKRLIQLMPLIL